MQKRNSGLPRFILFWTGVATFAIGLMITFNGIWSIFARWYEINFPIMAGIGLGSGVTALWTPVIVAYTPYVIAGSTVSIFGVFMAISGKSQYEGRSEPLATFILFWAGLVVLATGLGTFLFGLSQAIIARWQAINFPTEYWLPPDVPRDIWFPHLEWSMPYIFAGIIIWIIGTFMMKSGQRQLRVG